MNVPEVDAIVVKDLFELRASSSHHDVRRAHRRQFPAVDICVVQDIHSVDDNALLGSGLAHKHPRAIRDACVFLNYVVAGAGWRVVAIGPHRRPWIVRKQRALECITIVPAQGVRPGADRITHGPHSLGLLRRPSIAFRRRRGRRWIRRKSRSGAGRRRLTGLREPPRGDWFAASRTGFARKFAGTDSRKYRHDNQPSCRKLVVAHYRVTVVARLACAPEASPHGFRSHRAVQYLSAAVVLLGLLRINCEPGIDDLHDVIGADSEAVVGRIAEVVCALRPFEPVAESIEALNQCHSLSLTLRFLLNDNSGQAQTWRRSWSRHDLVGLLLLRSIRIIRPRAR